MEYGVGYRGGLVSCQYVHIVTMLHIVLCDWGGDRWDLLAANNNFACKIAMNRVQKSLQLLVCSFFYVKQNEIQILATSNCVFQTLKMIKVAHDWERIIQTAL